MYPFVRLSIPLCPFYKISNKLKGISKVIP